MIPNGNTSATGGPLLPLAPPAAGGNDLDVLLQGFITGVTGLDPTLVRPRWQPTPPNQPIREYPGLDADWCAFGITTIEPVGYPNFTHVPAGDGSDTAKRFKTYEITVSFIGPNAGQIAEVFQEGCYVAQNWETLQASSIGLVSCETATAVPELTNTLWLRQFDVKMCVSRIETRSYPIENVLSAGGTFALDDGLIEEWLVTDPMPV